MDPLVTCVVCAYDYGAYVEAAVRSVLAQQGLPDGALEVLVVDDGSTDATPQLLAGFGDAITVIAQRNAGPAVATNRAIARARGRWVSLLDADDVWLPDKLARQLALLARRPEVGLVHGDMEVIDAHGRVTRPSKYAWYGELPVVGRALGRLLSQNEATTSSITLRTELAQAIPPTPAWAWCRDWWLAAHVAATHEIDALHEPVAQYRIHGENVSAQDAHSERAVALWERDLKVRRLLLRELELTNATLDELALAWARFAAFLRKVADVRALAQTDVVGVEEADRATAAALRARAQELLRGDDADAAAAGRAAMRAMAADPFEPASAALFEQARAQLSPTPPAAPSSAAHRDRLDELARLRAAVDDAEGLRRWERLRASIGAAAALPAPTARERTEAFHALAAAVRAGDPAARRGAAARARALDPADDHALALLQPPAPLTARDRAQRDRFHERTAALDGARAFVALADAEAAIADPALLRAWADAFAPADDATLALTLAADADVAAVQARLVTALEQAGIAADGEHDLALAVTGVSTETPLARQAHAVLSAQPAPRALSGHPHAVAPDALRSLAERRWSHDGLGAPLEIAIAICPQRWDGAERWGDTHFARALADELERRGHRARLEVVAEWDGDAGGELGEPPTPDVAIHLRGLFPYVPREGPLNVLWSISHPDLVTTAEQDAYDLVLTPSARLAEQWARTTSTPVELLEQATNAAVFFPEHDPAHVRELVFVGNSRGVMRPLLRDLLDGGEPVGDLAVWGQQWERFLPARLIAGEHLPNDAVRRAYSSAAIVLNDHWDDMRTQGIVSNRVYDALACGALVLSDHLPQLAERFDDAVVTYRTPQELRASVARLLTDPAERAQRAARGRTRVLAAHTFRHRVDALLAAIAAQRAPGALKAASARPIHCS